MASERKPHSAKSIILKNINAIKMYDDNLHITPEPDKGYPQPEVPADEAWNNMAELLNAEMPVSPPDPASSPKKPFSGRGGISGSIGQMLGSALLILGVAGLVTWGVLRSTHTPETPVTINDSNNSNKQESFAKINDSIIPVRDTKTHDSVSSIHQEPTSPAVNINTADATDSHKIKSNLRLNNSANDNTIQSAAVTQNGSKKRNKQLSALAISSVSKQPANNSIANIPAKPVSGTPTTSINIIPILQPVVTQKSRDTVITAELQPASFSPDTVSVKLTDKTIPGVIAPVNPAGNVKPDNINKNAVPGESKKSTRMSENLSWQIDLSGNVGEVVQKGRNPNLFYGGMATAGLWHKKLKAGIETGIGWADYNDYGSVLNNVRITDTIPVDSVPVTHFDTTRIDAYKYRYQYIQVPLFISKQVLAKGKFALDIKTGPVIGFLISQRQIPDYTSGPENGEIVTTVNSDYSRLKISWQWDLMVQLRWNFNDRFSFTLSPSAIFYLNNLYDKNNRPASMPFGIGVNAGLIYRFK